MNKTLSWIHFTNKFFTIQLNRVCVCVCVERNVAEGLTIREKINIITFARIVFTNLIVIEETW